MSSSNRNSLKPGVKGPKVSDKNYKTDKTDTGKASGDKQQHANKENSKADEHLKLKVQQLIEMTKRSEEEVCLALHECNGDVNQATNMLFETEDQQWSVKKKKSRQPAAVKQDKNDDKITGGGGGDDWNENAPSSTIDKDKSRNKSGGPTRLHGRHNDNRGWRGREKQENERNLEEGGGRPDYQRDRRGRPGGLVRGSGRGRGGGRAGGGGRYPPRGPRSGGSGNFKPIDTWDNNSNTWDNNTALNATPAEENWDEFPGTDEWSTEEYTGSLADTKVFTPSSQMPSDQQPPTGSPNENQHLGPLDAASQQLGQTLQINQSNSSTIQAPGGGSIVGTLNAAQTQYLTQLTQQNSDKYGSIQNYQATSPAYNSSFANSTFSTGTGFGSGTNDQLSSHQPVRAKPQRARVPPPSKIPSSAVEMPGDLNSTMTFLDVQFGAMDFMTDTSSYDGGVVTSADKYVSVSSGVTLDNNSSSTNSQTANLDLNNATNQSSNLDSYTTSSKSNTQSSISSVLTQSLSNTDIPTSEHLAGTFSSVPQRSSTTGNSASQQQSVSQSSLDLNKQTADPSSYSQSSTYNSYQPKNSYNSSYNTAQTTAASYQSATNSYVNSQSTGGSYGSTNPNAANSYQNSYSSTGSYQTNTNTGAFPSISQSANSYSNLTSPAYAQNTSQSVYGANTGLNNSSNYGVNSSASQYNSYSSASSHKLVKDNTYDSTNNAVSSSTQSTTTGNNAIISSTGLSSTTGSGSKTTTTLASKNSNVVSNMPPGVTPVMSTPYNMVPAVPYFQQPVYSYEDVQLLQQRLPHMTTPYYDMSYQTPTTLAAVRDATLSNVGYSISDGRFARTDNNASPVPSTLSSQQTSTLTQGHQAQPILAGTATGPPFYFAATPFNNSIIPNYPFYQLPAATNAHGTNNSTQYGKPTTYGSSYGSYDALGQSQDYTKGSYVGNSQGQKGAGGNSSSTGSSGTDLSAMYGKSHAALGKVNSYEKQGFHSGTPPPFTGALHGNQNAGLAPSGTGYAPQVYIPAMTPHQQHHSTQLMHQPLHQDSSNSTGQRSQGSNQNKSGGKQYQSSYWNQA